MKRIIAIIAVAALTGCSTIPGGTELAAVGTAAVDALTGPDTDYKNYLTSCRAQIKAQIDAIEADSKTLQAGITSSDEKTRYGATLTMAFKAGQGGPRIGCSLERNPRLTELLLKDGSALEFGYRMYRDHKQDGQFKRQLAADERMNRENRDFQRDMEDRRNRLITTLTGDEKELRQQQNEYELDRQRLENQAPPAQ